jgi:hypothetical protein
MDDVLLKISSSKGRVVNEADISSADDGSVGVSGEHVGTLDIVWG